MATASYFQKGESLDYVNNTDEVIATGTIVDLSTRIGVAGMDINPEETGSLHVTGVFEIAKDTATELTVGQAVYFDGEQITSDTSGTPAGYAVAYAAASDETAFVKLLG